ncbi:bHLH113 protein [Hibiscus syriacus]|uniref:BHLH113 protein n=1 Tax=Hibiscus syriacus TaxID=106335 RepID=A0A6A2Y886_HIBSY|nr:bHLH113 protein [Hibiscus syriacus]
MMAESVQSFEGDQATATATTSTRFSQLLFGGGGDDDLGQVFGQESAIIATKKPAAGVACSDSSSASSGNNTKSFKAPSKSNVSVLGVNFCLFHLNLWKEGLLFKDPKRNDDAIVDAQPASRITSKKSKVENPATGHAKVRKEKIGDRITALQQLVSPFGKTDTASVLHEAMGYIRFVHDQVQVLCSPYLQHPPNGGEEAGKELKSRGLCLVPVACTLHVANSNGADFWSPSMGNNII